MTVAGAVSWDITSGTSPVVSAPTIFCISGAKGMSVKSISFPLAFSYPSTTAQKPMSSSRTKPCGHHTVTVLAAALASNGRPRLAAAAAPREPRSSKRRLSLAITDPPFLHAVVLRSARAHVLFFCRVAACSPSIRWQLPQRERAPPGVELLHYHHTPL